MEEPVKEIKFKCGTITIYRPKKVPAKEDKERLYRALLECVITKSVLREANKYLT